MLDLIAPLAERVYAVRPESPRAMEAEELCRLLAQRGVPAEPCPTVEAAVANACAAARTLRAGGGGYFPCGAECGVRGRLAGHRAADEAQGGIPRCISKGSRGV